MKDFQNELQEQKELTIILEAQLLTAQEELNDLTIKINNLPTWENLNEIEVERDKVKKEYQELKEKLEQITHEKQVLEVQFKDLSTNRLTSEEIKWENQKLTKNFTQSQNKVKELEKKVKELESEMLTEEIANKNILNQEREKQRKMKQELTEKREKMTNYEKRNEVSDGVIQRLKGEIRIKDQRIQELEQQLEMKVEVLPK